MKKRGQISTQVMIYAFGLIVLVLIIFWGYKGISSFSKASQTSALITFETKFKNEMESIAIKRGSVKDFTFKVPSGYDMFCAFDLKNEENRDSAIIDFYPIILDSLEDKTENVFLINKKNMVGFKSEMIGFAKYPYYYCNDIRNNIITFKAKGAISNGEPSALMIIPSKAEKNILSNQNEDIQLFSTDGMVRIEIPAGTQISPSPINLYIEVIKAGEQSEIYNFGPEGTTFTDYAEFHIKSADGCTDYLSKEFKLGIDLIGAKDCSNGYIEYHVNEI